MEHRCGYRRPVDVTVIVRTRAGLVGKGTLCEVSASGARIVTSVPLPVHSSVLIQFDVCSTGQRSSRSTVEAEVVRPAAGGFGLEWVRFAPEVVRNLFVPRKQAAAESSQMQPDGRLIGLSDPSLS